MSEAERLGFLAGTKVAVFSVAREAKGPLVAPVWYAYDPSSGFRMLMSEAPAKVRRLKAVQRASICVQDDVDQYQYVAAEGPVEISPQLSDAEVYDAMLSMGTRYLRPDEGAANAAEFQEDQVVLVTLKPERWNSDRV